MIKKHKDIQYPSKTFRLSEEVYQELKNKKGENESWNLFFKRLLNKKEKYV